MRGLCEAYLKAAGSDQALEPSSQARLEQAAGGPEKVAAYCAGLTRTAGDHSTSPATPASPSHPAPKATPSATARHATPSSPPSREISSAQPPSLRGQLVPPFWSTLSRPGAPQAPRKLLVVWTNLLTGCDQGLTV